MDKRYQGETTQKNGSAQYVRTEFGMEFSGDMNASKIYEILAEKNKKDQKK